MRETSGTLLIDGKEVIWDRMSSTGLAIHPGSGDVIHLGGEPDEERIRCALAGWNQGYAAGKQVGRSTLQNEFRNLMDCQPR
jgi:hypothetical protein